MKVKLAMKSATANMTFHQRGAGSSMMPQMRSVIQWKLRLLSTSVARGDGTGLHALTIGCASQEWSVQDPMILKGFYRLVVSGYALSGAFLRRFRGRRVPRARVRRGPRRGAARDSSRRTPLWKAGWREA